MASLRLRRITILKSVADSLSFSCFSQFFPARAAAFFGHGREYSVSSRIHLSPLFMDYDGGLKDCSIELMDDETWRVSSGLKDAWIANDQKVEAFKTRPLFCDRGNDGGIQMVNSATLNADDELDFDDIEDMRIRRSLFYELNKDSKEYEEYKFDFHRRKSLKEGKGKSKSQENKRKQSSGLKSISEVEETSKKDRPVKTKENKDDKIEEASRHDKNTLMMDQFRELGDISSLKKQRVPTFNQLTAPYHEPFCLDIYISKGSVRASIIHRATSNVVAVSHSISKDMKFELGSAKNRSACAAVGAVLTRRALADDIHNVIYTPKRGEKSVEKVQIVLKSIVDGGIDVKVKPKQMKSRKGSICGLRT